MTLTDAVGAVAATYKYDDWGNIVSSTGSINIPFGYRGRFGYVYDKETGLYFLKSRYYDPETARFTTKDRFRGFEDRPASQNQYTYCEGDPVNGVDPTGQRKRKLKDITRGFTTYMRANAKIAAKHKRDWRWFKDRVDSGKPWDLKKIYGTKTEFIFMGTTVTGEDLGNINYGYVGKAAGFPDQVLLAAAGYVQRRNGTTSVLYVLINSAYSALSIGTDPMNYANGLKNFDDPQDQAMANWGMDIYRGDN